MGWEGEDRVGEITDRGREEWGQRKGGGDERATKRGRRRRERGEIILMDKVVV